eukprot:UN4106
MATGNTHIHEETTRGRCAEEMHCTSASEGPHRTLPPGVVRETHLIILARLLPSAPSSRAEALTGCEHAPRPG